MNGFFVSKLDVRLTKGTRALVQATLDHERKKPGQAGFSESQLARVALIRYCIGVLGKRGHDILNREGELVV